jgi:hypothetical protein
VNATPSPDAEPPLIFGNYAVGFIDLLASVGSIATLQQVRLPAARYTSSIIDAFWRVA